jgi:hypothetical protein
MIPTSCPWRRVACRSVLLAVSLAVVSTVPVQPVSACDGMRGPTPSLTVLQFRAKLVDHQDPRPPKEADRSVKLSAQAAKLKQVQGELKRLCEEGFNAVVWTGPNELWVPAPHAIIRHREFPEARELSPDDNELAIDYMKAVFTAAKRLGLKNFLYTLCIWYTPAFEISHGYDKPLPVSMTVNISQNLGWPVVGGATNCGVRNELTRKYTEAVFAASLPSSSSFGRVRTATGVCTGPRKGADLDGHIT